MALRRFFLPLMKPIRKWIRNRTRPMSYDEATEKKEFYSKLYFASSISLFTGLCYITYTKRVDFNSGEGLPSHLALLNRTNTTGNVRYIKIEGLKITENYVFDSDSLREEYREKNINKQDENKSDSNSE